MLTRAESLVGGWRWRRALVLYRQILAAEPHNAEIHGRAAPLLARSGRTVESWESFQIAIRTLKDAGDTSALRALEQESVRALPLHLEACRGFARAELARGKPREAMRVLFEGSRRLRGSRHRGAAIVLLREAREIEAWNPAIVLPLCRRLSRDGQPAEALFLLDHLEQRVAPEVLPTVRALIWRIEPSLRHTWRWTRAAREARAQRAEGLSRQMPSRS